MVSFFNYTYTNEGVNNGWLNYFAITAFDQGDPDANLESLESSLYSNRTYVYPGISMTDNIEWVGEPTVYPNPIVVKRYGMGMAVETRGSGSGISR
ncbi:MAG: hypothetical protein Ct9H300mP9_7600 [Candidatus Neomarinimicrobiota bacterium]|nr:MAG: hypothetical protein Ct9H300mP9_7600 [Candidatus Neomarinimicrobiota bacterium]